MTLYITHSGIVTLLLVRQMNSSAIVNLEAAVESDNSDYEMDYESGITDKKG